MGAEDTSQRKAGHGSMELGVLWVSPHPGEHGCFPEWLQHCWKEEDRRKHEISCLVVRDTFENSHRPFCLLLLLVTGEYLFRKSCFFFSVYTLIIEIVLIKAKARQCHVPVRWGYVLRRNLFYSL